MCLFHKWNFDVILINEFALKYIVRTCSKCKKEEELYDSSTYRLPHDSVRSFINNNSTMMAYVVGRVAFENLDNKILEEMRHVTQKTGQMYTFVDEFENEFVIAYDGYKYRFHNYKWNDENKYVRIRLKKEYLK